MIKLIGDCGADECWNHSLSQVAVPWLKTDSPWRRFFSDFIDLNG